MKQYNYIYLITNKINGKIYIGKHSTDNLNDGYMGSGLLLANAKKKYGIENFSKDYLVFCDTKEKLNWFEKFYIKKFKALDRSIGYNISEGGDGGVTHPIGWTHTDESKLKMSEAKKGKPSHWKGKHHSEQTKEKMRKPKTEEHKKKLSEATKRQIKENGHPRQGAHMSDESKHKSSMAPGHRSEETRAKLREAWVRRKNELNTL